MDLFKTRGIVFSVIPYSESSIIVKIFTEEFGIKSYIIKGARNSKSSLRSNIFQPLQILDLEVYNNPKKNLQIIKEAKLDYSIYSISSDIKKTTLAFFIAEIVNHCIKEEEKNIYIYSFIEDTIISLNNLEYDFSIFHLNFLLNLSELLGFKPMNDYSNENKYFDLSKGHFSSLPPVSNLYLSLEESLLLSNLLSIVDDNTKNKSKLSFAKEEKSKLLNILIQFYEIHIIDFSKIKSQQVLSTILH
ncbi:MAG: recombination protein RecO [Bacteroidetes bacterium]|nr:recombination protein RecO [Bacteroidota bacterium]